MAPGMAHAQTNIDEGKTPAQIFANDCATCHKSPRGLSGGKGSLVLRGFLAEHYTASKEQAAALAAYVLGAGGDLPPATPGRGPKSGPEHARLPSDETAPAPHPTRQSGKHDGEAPATAKLQPPGNDGMGSANPPSIIAEPGSSGPERHPPGRHGGQPRIGIRGHQKEPDIAPPALPAPVAPPAATVIAEPATPPPQDNIPNASPAPVGSSTAPSATAPSNADSSDGAAVPRDNIPD
jgi:hypothetical protein